ncbi:PD-(D/E)XK nuclease family protein [Sphingomonas sp.]|jgi:ATP-dependent helicase/nuclease subunit B|uniref:PD-(D/E)XK nuclease family protein n=1 Tax=Sphingomonas sp. TaxID=28214 RepID=UPI002D80F3ED|nr:PD-(D/E)XK nuclease family protein [Sphingomonas sp.]HEU0044864.1 PD-(D/E)XK nuclease family protein [Sphingomonas sp.]
MAERGLRLFTIPPHRAFADALVAGLRRRTDADPLALARATVLLPNNRAVRAVTDAFVRASGGGLLLPRLVALGDPEAGETLGAALDPADGEPIPPAVDPYRRRLTLARLVGEERRAAGQPVNAGEAVRLAGELQRTLDQLLVEEVSPAELRGIDLDDNLSEHWARALATFSVVLDRWPEELARLGCIDAADRRGRLLERAERRWRQAPPGGLVCAAGVSDSAPAVARLLRRVAELPSGLVVFAGLDLAMDEEEWAALGPHKPDPETRLARPSIETHPQFHLKLLLERMGAVRGEVKAWREAGGRDADPARARAIANALAPAAFTGRWTDLPAADRRLTGVMAAELATPAEEAQAVALALRGALEAPGRTAALVTPDRALARRVAAHLGRWGIQADDTAGRPLSILPPGTLLLLLAEAAAQRWSPLPLLALLKHPLVQSGDARLAWLDGVRAMDRQLRGPRPATGLEGIGSALRGVAASFWSEAADCLSPLERTYGDGAQPLGTLLACLRETAQALCGDALWAGPAGRAAAEFLSSLETEAPHGPALVDPDEVAPMLRVLLDEVAVRPPQGGHPRLAIYGLIEARLQSADLFVLAGLNEGTWPGKPAPDPWLAPPIRAKLGLPGLERRVGIAAHDFAQGLGAPDVLITRARRDAGSPALASRLWLRLQAMAGERFERAFELEGWTRALDRAADHLPAGRPAPLPHKHLRPLAINVTEVDRLKADPYAFYARRVLKLLSLDPVDADPSAAWRGSAVHDILEQWWVQDRCAVAALKPRAEQMLRDESTHPLMRALWQPRLMEAIDWIARRVATHAEEGREVVSAEGKGSIELHGVTLTGRYDRIDRCNDGGLAIIDYKTGKAPSTTAVREGYSLQLGLLGIIAERGGFADAEGYATAFEYWSLAKSRDGFGSMTSPCDPAGKANKILTEEFTAVAERRFQEVVGRWLTGEEAFTAKLHPEYAPYAEYDQLMRRDEWYGRD